MGYRCADVALFTSKWLAYVLDGQLLALYLSSVLSFPPFSNPLLILYNPCYAGVYLYWRRFASSSINIGVDPPPSEIIRKKRRLGDAHLGKLIASTRKLRSKHLC